MWLNYQMIDKIAKVVDKLKYHHIGNSAIVVWCYILGYKIW